MGGTGYTSAPDVIIGTPVGLGTTTYTVQGGFENCPVLESVQIEVVPNSVAGVIADIRIANRKTNILYFIYKVLR